MAQKPELRISTLECPSATQNSALKLNGLQCIYHSNIIIVLFPRKLNGSKKNMQRNRSISIDWNELRKLKTFGLLLSKCYCLLQCWVSSRTMPAAKHSLQQTTDFVFHYKTNGGPRKPQTNKWWKIRMLTAIPKKHHVLLKSTWTPHMVKNKNVDRNTKKTPCPAEINMNTTYAQTAHTRRQQTTDFVFHYKTNGGPRKPQTNKWWKIRMLTAIPKKHHVLLKSTWTPHMRRQHLAKSSFI